MIYGIASLVFIPLLAISIVHAMWAFGSTWPVQDEKTLARTVAGFKGIERMPSRFMSAAVAILIFIAAIWALTMSDPSESPLITSVGAVLALVFLLRGGVGFTKKWRELTPEEPFATFDKKVYSPLCIGLGLGFALLTYWRF